MAVQRSIGLHFHTVRDRPKPSATVEIRADAKFFESHMMVVSHLLKTQFARCVANTMTDVVANILDVPTRNLYAYFFYL